MISCYVSKDGVMHLGEDIVDISIVGNVKGAFDCLSILFKTEKFSLVNVALQ